MNQILSWLVGLVAIVLPGFGAPTGTVYNGYIEADYVYAAALDNGLITQMDALEGQRIKEGALLFSLDNRQQRALLAAAEARVAAAQASVENLETGGREAEVAVVRAQLAKAKADLALAEQTLERTRKLVTQGTLPQARLDQDEASRQSAEAQMAQLQAQLRVAELPARSAEQKAAEANLAAAKAEAAKAKADLVDRKVMAPVGGVIEKVYFAQGEMAPAGTPIVSIRPDGALKAKFYIGEADRAGFRLGQEVSVFCDGCEKALSAKVSFLASEPEHTPPIIYSREERDRLVFLAEARIEGGNAPMPGQPVSVRPLP